MVVAETTVAVVVSFFVVAVAFVSSAAREEEASASSDWMLGTRAGSRENFERVDVVDVEIEVDGVAVTIERVVTVAVEASDVVVSDFDVDSD